MKTAIVTDGKYRSSIAAVRALHRAGYQVIVTQTRADAHAVPAVAASRCCAAFRWIDGAAADDSYADRLAALLETYDRPVLFCVGAVTLNTVAAQRERFARVADFLIAPRPVLDALNDKETVHARAQSLGIPVPRQYDGVPPERYPVVIKPHCGEKFGLKAADRYAVADTPEAYAQILARMQRYDPAPIVQDRITGPGIGVRFDHYPDIHCDEQGGAEHNDRLIRRMLAEGHQITNHGYRHILFGKKPFVYGAREYLPGFDAAVEDLGRLHALMQTRYGYTMTLARPPHYVDKMTGGFTSYDVYDHMGYQYMAASFDGAGWLPSTDPDPEAALQAEIRAMVEPMRKALEKDPDFFCGQIIFQKDGYNMAKRTPVAFALGQQLALLQEYGYQVVPVGELLAESPFADVGREEPLFDRLTALAEQRAIVFSDNRLRLDDPMTVGELAMLLTPKADAIARRVAQLRRTGRAGAYDGAMAWCRENGLVSAAAHPADRVTALPEAWFVPMDGFTRRDVYAAFRMERL